MGQIVIFEQFSILSSLKGETGIPILVQLSNMSHWHFLKLFTLDFSRCSWKGKLLHDSKSLPRAATGRLIFIHLRCWELLPVLTSQRQRCIKFRVLRLRGQDLNMHHWR